MLNLRLQFILLVIILAISSQSCSKLNNAKNEIVFQCGPDALDVDSYYVKILDSQGKQLSAESMGQLNVEFVRGDSTSQITLTTKSCVKLSSSVGTLSVSSSRLQESLVENLNLSDNFIYLKLIPSPVVEAKFLCPSNGIYAHNLMDNPWDIAFKGNPKALDLKIIATSETDSLTVTLFHKKSGDDNQNIPKQFDTSKLLEGAYRVEAVYGFNSETWQSPLNLVQKQVNCPMVVLHTKPALEDNGTFKRTVAPETIIPNFETHAGSEISHCFAPRIEVGGITQCGESKFCQDENNFIKGAIRAPKIAGVYDLLVKSTGPTKIQSDSKCEHLIVSNQATNIDVSWDRESWRDGFAFFDWPYVDVKAKISKVPGLVRLPDEQLQCRVDLLLNHSEPFRSSRIKCRSGSCKGLSMDEYVPCDETIHFTVDKIWTTNVKQGVLRLYVRSDDGAGHTVEKVAKAWISTNSWITTDLNSKSIDNDPRRDKDFGIYIAEDYSPVVYNDNVFIYNNLEWRKILPNSELDTGEIEVIGESSHVMWGRQKLKDKKVNIYQLIGGMWKFRYQLSSSDFSGNVYSADGIVFNNERSLVFIDQQSVSEFPGFDRDKYCYASQFYYDKIKFQAFAMCSTSLWVFKSEEWKKIAHELYPITFESLVFEKESLLLKIKRWTANGSELRGVLQLSNDLSSYSVTFESSPRIVDFKNPEISNVGILLSDEEFWDAESNGWKPVDSSSRVFPSLGGNYSEGYVYGNKSSKINFQGSDGTYFRKDGENLFLPDDANSRIVSVNFHDGGDEVLVSSRFNSERKLVQFASNRLIYIPSGELGLSITGGFDFAYDEMNSEAIRLIGSRTKFEFKDGFFSKIENPNWLLRDEISIDGIIYESWGNGYLDRSNRTWFICKIRQEKSVYLCMINNQKISSFLVEGNMEEIPQIILSSNEIFLKDRNSIYSKSLNDSGTLTKLDATRFTKNLFPFENLTFKSVGIDLLMLKRSGSNQQSEYYEYNFTTNSLRRLNFNYEEAGAELDQYSTDSLGRYFGKNKSGIFQEIDGIFKRVVDSKDIGKVSLDSRENISNFKIEKKSNRIWILTSSGKLYLYENESKL